MTRRLLVVTTVHQPDDARIRSKLIATLASEWEVTYAARVPGPSDTGALTWLPLRGGRGRRWLAAARQILSKRWDLVAIHDPELLPLGLFRSWVGQPTLFDLHENVPAQIRHKSWLPSPIRPVIAWLALRLLRWAEATMTVTLAEDGYQRLFRADHPVIENYLVLDGLPAPVPESAAPFLAYVGDITLHRGAFLAVEAAAGAGVGLVMVGRVAPAELAPKLLAHARTLDVDLELVGPLPHAEAMERVKGARAGLSPLLDIPNYRNSLPTKILEYLALGLGVLASDLPGTRQVGEGAAGVVFVKPGDGAAWREAGRQLGADTSFRSAAQGEAESVRARYGWPAQRVLSVYREAVPE